MKSSAIMVRCAIPLRMLQLGELEILSRVLFSYFSGLDEEHTARWRRLWTRLFRRDDVLTFYPVVERSGNYHAMHMAIETRIFANQDGFMQLKPFRNWLKTGAAFGRYEASNGRLVFVPSSLSYEDCSDDEMRQFHKDAVAFLRTPHALKVLWPAMKREDRAETLELMLKNPNDET